jgi:hypothetical protein
MYSRKSKTYRFLSFLFLLSSIFGKASANKIDPVKPWKGFAIIGNGSLCAVYSDDPRTSRKGIQHLYYKNYSCSYVQSTSSDLFNSGTTQYLHKTKEDSVGMANFFTTSTQSYYEHSLKKEVKCFAYPDNAIVVSVNISSALANITQNTGIVLQKKIVTDRLTTLQSVKLMGGKAVAEWSNHTYLVVGCNDPSQKITVSDSLISVSGSARQDFRADIIITISETAENGILTIDKLISEKDLLSSAGKFWEAWMNHGIIPQFKSNDETGYLESYKRNLYSIKSALLEGFVPADITGFFSTNNMPQLYPRDAMMCARVFLLSGHIDEARDIITFWTNKKISMKSKGEWYARYDANTNAVDAGSGARFDEPEWDANGYFIQLLDMYHKKTNIWLADSSLVYELADFLVSKIDRNGLVYEGGIVEWSGYLPATNMTCAAALKTASKIALSFGDTERANRYERAGEKISASLSLMFDKKDKTYADLRFVGKKDRNNKSSTENKGDSLYLWDTTMNFGVLWGYPNHQEVESSNEYYQMNTVKNGGGVQYFASPDHSLAGYGNCMFFFSTAARAQYLSLYGDPKMAKTHIDWMIRNANTYGLMPERVAVDGSDLTSASPLSWCCAEFCAAVLLYQTNKK